MTTQQQPAGICLNCFRTWQARRPQPIGIYCWHTRTAARPSARGGWKILEAVGAQDLAVLRAEGLL